MGVAGDVWGFTIEAADDTAKAFNAVLGKAAGFGKSLAHAILEPIKHPLETFAVIEVGKSLMEGAEVLRDWAREAMQMQVVEKEFTNRLNISEKQAYAAARAFQEAANGAMDLDTTMQSVSRLIGKGLNAEQIGKIFQFASLSAKATGRDFEEMVSGISGALATGRLMMLKQIGLAGFEDKRPATQAEAQAMVMEAIDQKLQHMAVSGKENIFIWDRMETAVKDVKIAITETIGSSEVLTQVVGKIGTMADGLRDFLYQNAEAIKEVLNSVIGGMGTGLKAIFGPVVEGLKSMLGGISAKGILEAFTNLGFLASKAMLGLREGMLRAKIVALQIVDTFVKIGAGDNALTRILGFTGEQREAMQKFHYELVNSMYDAGYAIQDLHQEQGKLNEDWAEAIKKIRDMKEGAQGIKSPFEGLGNKFRQWVMSMAAPIKEGFPGIVKDLQAFAKKAGEALGSTADAMKERWQSALDKVKELRQQLAEIKGERRDFAWEGEQQNFEVAKAQLKAQWGQFAEPLLQRADLRRAAELIARSREATNPEQADKLRKASIDLLMPLATNEQIRAGRGGVNPRDVDNFLAMARGLHGLDLKERQGALEKDLQGAVVAAQQANEQRLIGLAAEAITPLQEAGQKASKALGDMMAAAGGVTRIFRAMQQGGGVNMAGHPGFVADESARIAAEQFLAGAMGGGF